MLIRFPYPNVDILNSSKVIEKTIESYNLVDKYQKKEHNIYLLMESLNFLDKVNAEFFTYIQKEKNRRRNNLFEELEENLKRFPPNILSKIEVFNNFELNATFEDIKKRGFKANFGDYIRYMKYNHYWLIEANKKFKENSIEEAVEILYNLYKISYKLLLTQHFFPIAMGINSKLEISKTLIDNILYLYIKKENYQPLIDILKKMDSIKLDKFVSNEYKMVNLVILITMDKIYKSGDYLDILSKLIGTDKIILAIFKPFLPHLIKREMAIAIDNLENGNFNSESLNESLLQYVITFRPSTLELFYRRVEASRLFDKVIIDIINKKDGKNFNFEEKKFDFYQIKKCDDGYILSIWDKKEPQYKLYYHTMQKIFFKDFIYKQENIKQLKCSK